MFVWVCSRMYACILVCVEANTGCPLFAPHLIFFIAGSLTEPGAHCLGYSGWLASSKHPPASASPALGWQVRASLTRMLKTDLRSSCSLSRHFTAGASAPVSLRVEFLVHSVPPLLQADPSATQDRRKQLTLQSDLLPPGSQGHCSAWGGMWAVKAGKITQV